MSEEVYISLDQIIQMTTYALVNLLLSYTTNVLSAGATVSHSIQEIGSEINGRSSRLKPSNASQVVIHDVKWSLEYQN